MIFFKVWNRHEQFICHYLYNYISCFHLIYYLFESEAKYYNYMKIISNCFFYFYVWLSICYVLVQTVQCLFPLYILHNEYNFLKIFLSSKLQFDLHWLILWFKMILMSNECILTETFYFVLLYVLFLKRIKDMFLV